MATIAKGMITLSSVNDAFSVSLNPNSCVINADWDGSNPRLDNAYTDIRVYRGDVGVEFSQPIILGYSNSNITATVTKIDNKTWRVKFATIDTLSLNGKVNLKIVVGTEFATTVSFGYTVVRETSMLDWILDWEGRAKTEIAGEHIITPKIFVGKSENGGQLTGTYIGPAFDDSGRTGVFGYSAGVEIFHLDNTGGMIGGWQITTGGIATADGNLKILSEGSIISAPGGTLAWELKKDGSATFAKGNVKFEADGNAEFAGKVTAKSGHIGGWSITPNQLHNESIIIDAVKSFIGINASEIYKVDPTTGDHDFPNTIKEGIKMWYTSAHDWGFAGWKTSKKVFELGSTNRIAGWSFDDTCLWLGTKNNTARQNTVDIDSITIGSSGLRGLNWYIDTDGEISFVNGLIHFTENGGTLCGWTLTSNHLAAEKSALVSAQGYVGLYLSCKTLPEAVSSYQTAIMQSGGIYLANGAEGPILKATTTEGKTAFKLSSGISYIGGWNFAASCLYTGETPTVTGAFASENNITLSPDGLRGYKFRLEANGAGAIAGGNIAWEPNGDITFIGTKMKWAGTDTTIIDADGIFTGKISADNITAGTISTASIKCEGKWALNTDGSGYLASENIRWEPDGTLTIKGNITADTGKIGAWIIDADKRLASEDGKITLDATLHKITLSTDEVTSGSDGMMSEFYGFGSKITLSTSNGAVTTALARTSYTDHTGVTYTAPSTGVSYLSPQGIFSNLAGIRVPTYTLGLRAAIVGLGRANCNKDDWESQTEMTAVAGVYGESSNSGTAPAYGGYFYNLKANGLILNRRFITDSSAATTQLTGYDVVILGLCNSGVSKTVYLPNDGIEGRVVLIKQMGAGTLRVDTSGGQAIYDNNTENDYYDIPEGYMGIFVFGIWDKDNKTNQIWSVNRILF
jgi:hypothetical protein